ncbi:MAG: hypothetical protein WEB37_04625, partial [Bacteroidota bacterium]
AMSQENSYPNLQRQQRMVQAFIDRFNEDEAKWREFKEEIKRLRFHARFGTLLSAEGLNSLTKRS